MENIKINSSDVKRLHELSTLYQEIDKQAQQLHAEISQSEQKVLVLIEQLDLIRQEENSLYDKICEHLDVERSVAIEAAINTIMQ